MAPVASSSLARQLGSLFEGGSAAGLSDRQLLERFTRRGGPADEAAFAAIAARHGPMVLGVCRQLLGDHHHAEDAFQATFFVLARQARSIRDPDRLGTWLYGVALRTARKARTRLARRRQTDQDGAARQPEAPPARAAEQGLLDRERAEALHVEIDRLPGAFRLPVVLCYFEGLTLDEAAHRLRWPVGTLRSRLARARAKLRRGLTRRGVAPSGAALAVALAPRSASASVPSLLCDSTTRAAIQFAARHAAGGALSSPASAMAQEVLRTMLIHKLRLSAFSLLLLAATAGYLAGPLSAAAQSREGELPGEPKAQRARTEPRPIDAPRPADAPRASDATHPTPGRMFVVGRVLDPQGRPVPSASVMVYGALKNPGRQDQFGGSAPMGLGRTNVDSSGRFRLDMPRISSSTHFGAAAAAIAPGYGVGWVDVDVDTDHPAAEIALRPEQVIQGRLFDVHGQAASGVRVWVEAMGHVPHGPDDLPENVDGPYFWGGDGANDLPAWPRPTVSDAEGRFTIRGVGRELRALLVADDPRFARQRLIVETDSTDRARQITAAMEPAKVFTGRVTYADTGKPVPHTALEVVAFRGGAGYTNAFRTDTEGRFRANPFSTDRYAVNVYAPAGQPYLNASTGIFDWPKGALEHRVDLTLARGTVLRGKVVEDGTGRPVPRAMLGYVGHRDADAESGPWNSFAVSGPDGSFQFAVKPGMGTLIVLGPSEDYVLRQMSRETITEGRPGGMRWYAHAFIPCDLKPGTDSREIDVSLRRGATVKTRVLGPDGQPVREARVYSLGLLLPSPVPWRFFHSGDFHADVHDGRFEMHGLAPDADVPAYFFDPRNPLGASARFSVKAAKDGPITVRLEPSGMAMARLVDRNGRPLAGYRNPYLITLVVTPGPDRLSRAEADRVRLAADQDYLSRIDPTRYAELITDAQGRITFPALIPGATYRIIDQTTVDAATGRQVRKEFVAGAGAAIELGDIVIEKPRP